MNIIKKRLLFPVQQQDKNPGHTKEFRATEENCSRKKETYLKGNTTITGAISLSQGGKSHDNNNY